MWTSHAAVRPRPVGELFIVCSRWSVARLVRVFRAIRGLSGPCVPCNPRPVLSACSVQSAACRVRVLHGLRGYIIRGRCGRSPRSRRARPLSAAPLGHDRPGPADGRLRRAPDRAGCGRTCRPIRRRTSRDRRPARPRHPRPCRRGAIAITPVPARPPSGGSIAPAGRARISGWSCRFSCSRRRPSFCSPCGAPTRRRCCACWRSP